jgi:hypothetical protein
VTREFPFTLTGVQSSEEPSRDLKSRIIMIALAIREPADVNMAKRIRAVPVRAKLSPRAHARSGETTVIEKENVDTFPSFLIFPRTI